MASTVQALLKNSNIFTYFHKIFIKNTQYPSVNKLSTLLLSIPSLVCFGKVESTEIKINSVQSLNFSVDKKRTSEETKNPPFLQQSANSFELLQRNVT